MKRFVFLWFFTIFLSFFAGLLLTKQYPQIFDKFKSISSGIKSKFYPPKIVDNISVKDDGGFDKIINANSFNVSVKTNDFVSVQNEQKNPQLNNSGLYAFLENNKVILRYFTRNGFEISNDYKKKYVLPNTYDPHNGKGGIRGVFFFEENPYALMASKEIGCQFASIINLNNSREIFRTDCLIDLSKINYDGVGGASIHKENKILLSIGTPSNNSQLIRSLAQNKNSFFGKVISIDKNNLKNIDYNEENVRVNADIFTMGHRNPQGLAETDKKFYSAEHGPKGGDEINLLYKNANFGWPVSSYGTKYYLEPNSEFNAGEKIIKFYENSHSKFGFTEPVFQFTPSIAISALTNCPKILEKYYQRKGCLISTSLKDKSLYIFILDENQSNKIIGFEKIQFERRLRNFALNDNGKLFENRDTIFVTTDDGYVLEIKFEI